MEKKMHLAIILSIFLFLEVNPTDADIFNGSGTSCKPSKLQPILESSMQKVLREFGFNNSQNGTDLTDAAQDCPSDWFRILDSCLWVSPPGLMLNAENATSYCQTKLPNSRLFEPISHVQNTLARELVTALDGMHRNEYLWIGKYCSTLITLFGILILARRIFLNRRHLMAILANIETKIDLLF